MKLAGKLYARLYYSFITIYWSLDPKYLKKVRFSENLNVFGGISELKITTIFATVIHFATRPHFILARDNLTSFNKIEGPI